MDSEAEGIAREWGLTGLREIASTATSRVYRVDGPAVLKVLTEIGRHDEGPGAVALEYFGGVGAVRLLRASENAQLLEFLEGPNLLGEPDEAATSILCDLLMQLHASGKPLPRGLVTLERRFASLLEYDGSDALSRDGAAAARELLAAPENVRVLHGDLHHENVLLSRDRGWVAIDPKGLVGEATFDAANLVFNPIRHPEQVRDPKRIERQLALIAERMGFDRARFRLFAFAYGALSLRWCEEDGLDGGLTRAVTQVLR